MKENQKIYNSNEVIAEYKKKVGLTTPESVLFNWVKKNVSCESILDIGVGAGRTTHFYAPVFKKYIGVDYSENMINSCRVKYANFFNAEFIHADANGMPEFTIDKFDLIQFSLNGIDYLETIEERINLLSKLFLLLKNKGVFIFSTHNVYSLYRLYSFQIPRNPFKIPLEISRYLNLRKINGNKENYLNKTFFRIYDGGENFKVNTCYIAPEFQYKLLVETGFNDIVAYDLKGKEIDNNNLIQSNDDWIHFKCRKIE